MAADWSDIEIALIIEDYFSMLKSELAGESYNKTFHRHSLLPLLINRSEGSIEFKHQNISAVLAKLGQPFIIGYLPRYNYQKVLEDKVLDYLIGHKDIENEFRIFSEKEVIAPVKVQFDNILVEGPEIKEFKEPRISYNRNPIKVNYLEREQNNRNLGMKGEELVLYFEKWELRRIGKEKLADTVRWIAKEEGNGAGFDILSKYSNGKDKYVEVKTTKLSKEAPFYFTQNELLFSKDYSKDYHLFRLFNFEKDAKMFTKIGSLDSICNSTPVTYRGYF
ncbi:MAG TPA: DUF3883 domain-containing protein [Bacteroidales bacterium]|nr:DUF3883 domain-containing protein [Bacteroidales bacterium]